MLTLRQRAKRDGLIYRLREQDGWTFRRIGQFTHLSLERCRIIYYREKKRHESARRLS